MADRNAALPAAFGAAAALIRLVAIYALCACSGWLCARMGLPLPWMIGPLLTTAAMALSGMLPKALPVRTRPFGQAVVASTVGLSFTTEALHVVIATLPLLVGMATMTAVLALGLSVMQARIARVRLSRMALATFPVAPVEAAIIAESCGIPPAPVVMAQTLRIAAIVVTVPLLLYAIDGRPDALLPVRVADAGHPALLAVVVLLAASGGQIFRRLGWANPHFLGPLTLTAIVTASGIALPHYPPPVLAAAQILLGAWLGSTFQTHLFRGAWHEMVVSLIGTVLLLALTSGGALILARLSGLNWETAILGTAPGGVTEMALTAQYLRQDVALVTAAHVVRIFLLMPLARPLIRLLDRHDRADAT
ncbi:AbrB family transcriptional regulator [Paracoccus sp. MBLB3053]|uniref:AbrB family transcriptional regulator n=1 Tax=Paracoccus aurantius TaxID=3073814 RepID=A0ABU2HW47_9RHOB|nr:AbrB family transcriptional regulator [Paracoccus sp. MBLB3053]MDS9468819.1 AbrB family transcriptional regulator [Paracoccus sp. MBLB3053]